MNKQQLELLVENLQLINVRLIEVQTRPTIFGTQDAIDIGSINTDLLKINRVLLNHLHEQEEES